MTPTTIDLIRHGEPVGGKKYRGQTDDPLSEKGWVQMRAAVGTQRPWCRIVSSTLSRCSAFAQDLAQTHSLPLELDDRLKEIGFGAWEGHTSEQLQAMDPLAYARFFDDPVKHRPPGAEPLHEFRDRVIAAWDELLERHAGRHVLVVAHAGVIRMVIRHVLDIPLERMYRIHVGNASLTRVQIAVAGNTASPRLMFHDGRLD
jgi:alpha-ribazole phosphatase/probable phosphoglycerate mutase